MSQSQPESRFGICASCKESKNVSDLIIAPCGHPYCRQCLRELFENAVSNEASFPARCCHQRIHLEPNIQYLEEDLVRQYRAKAVEYSSVQRIYCHQLRCSAFIPPEDRTNNDALCRACQSHTCTLCKGPAHTGACPRNYALERVLAVAQENGWRRCPGCQTLIEWNTGCYHMTCRCGAEFCYTCGRAWGTCRCERFFGIREQRILYGQPAPQVLAARLAGRENPNYRAMPAIDSDSEDSGPEGF